MSPHEEALRNILMRIKRFTTKDLHSVSLLMLISEDCIKALNTAQPNHTEVLKKVRELVNEASP